MPISESDLDSPPKLSVVVGTTEREPAIAACLARLAPQARRVSLEIIVVYRDPQGLPAGLGEQPAIKLICSPGASIFELRAVGNNAANGEIIAFTEDHCLVAENWCEQIIALHRQKPDAAVIGGVMKNASSRHYVDIANFFLTFGLFTAARNTRQVYPPPAANISCKRAAIPQPLSAGELEFVLNPRLCAAGLSEIDDSLIVEHVQSRGFQNTCAAHFHNGRASAGMISLAPAARFYRLLRCVALPLKLSYRGARAMHQNHLAGMLTTLPLFFSLAICHSAGEAVGLVAGAGKSPWKLY